MQPLLDAVAGFAPAASLPASAQQTWAVSVPIAPALLALSVVFACRALILARRTRDDTLPRCLRGGAAQSSPSAAGSSTASPRARMPLHVRVSSSGVRSLGAATPRSGEDSPSMLSISCTASASGGSDAAGGSSGSDDLPPCHALPPLPRSGRPSVGMHALLREKLPPWHQGPNVDDLIQKHRSAIDALRASARAQCPGFVEGEGAGCHDDLFALRFLLSHKLSVDKAGAAMRRTIEWRARVNADAIREFVLRHPQSAFPGHDQVCKYFDTPIVLPGGADTDWPPFMYVHASTLDPAGLMARFTVDQYVTYSMYMSELMFAHCDRVTRRTRHLTKTVRVVAMGGIRLRHASMAFARAASAAAADHVDCYPQALGVLFLCGVPLPMKIFWDSALGPLLPERVVEKTKMINPAASAKDLDELTDHVPLDVLPEAIYPKARHAGA